MQLDHAHIPRTIKDNKRIQALSSQRPLLLILSSECSFLNLLAEAVLTYYSLPFEIHSSSGEQLMEFTPPLVCYEDAILSEEGLVEFLCDVALSRNDFDQFVTRKENVKRIYQAWRSIFRKEQLSTKGTLSLLTRHDPSSNIYHELHLLARDVANRGYQRAFPSYRPEEFSIEVMLLLDIRQTILNQCPKETCDYLLRGGFPALLDIHPNYLQQCLANREDYAVRAEQPSAIFVLLDKKEAAVQEFPKVNLNIKWFLGVLVGVSLAFGKWAH